MTIDPKELGVAQRNLLKKKIEEIEDSINKKLQLLEDLKRLETAQDWEKIARITLELRSVTEKILSLEAEKEKINKSLAILKTERERLSKELEINNITKIMKMLKAL